MEEHENVYFILLANETIPASGDLFHDWYQNPRNRIVRRKKIGSAIVSTVFLGINHAMSLEPSAEPVLFETMVFGGRFHRFQNRRSTYEQALEMHCMACRMVAFPGLYRLKQKIRPQTTDSDPSFEVAAF